MSDKPSVPGITAVEIDRAIAEAVADWLDQVARPGMPSRRAMAEAADALVKLFNDGRERTP